MAGPNGFVQRWKGKVVGAAYWVSGAGQVFGNGSAITYSTTGTQTMGQEAVSLINSSSAISIFSLSGAAPVHGIEKQIHLLTVSSGVFIKAGPGTSFDPSTNTVIKSTYAMMITLLGESSVKWGIKAVFPPPSTLVGGSGITLTTTT